MSPGWLSAKRAEQILREAEIRQWADRVCLDPRYTNEATDEEAERVTNLLEIIDDLRKLADYLDHDGIDALLHDIETEGG